LDSDVRFDYQITINELKATFEKLKKWTKVFDAETTFKQMDTNKSGKVTFGEFVKWADSKNLDLENDNDNPKLIL
jgi:Ca2+-binding EF-hand superfamily protein